MRLAIYCIFVIVNNCHETTKANNVFVFVSDLPALLWHSPTEDVNL